ncbi:hypothetical protein ACHQM5_019650 [Ranunculus cassubicifolius]
MKRFLWGSTKGEKKYNLVNWEEVCVSMENGGLGLRRVLDVNIAMLTKWLWKLAHEEKSLWKMVIIQKYGVETGGWYSKCNSGPIKFSFWRAILKCNEFFRHCTSVVIGNGQKTLFWTHHWVGNDCLRSRFPRLYAISNNQHGTVSEFYSHETQSWNLYLKRRLSDSEISEAAQLIVSIDDVSFSDTEDRLQWQAGGKDFTERFRFKWCFFNLCRHYD